MKLELGKFPVSAVREGSNTGYRDGVLTLDTESLTRLVLENPAIVHARIEIARPGDSVRVVGYRDVVAPQIKVEGPGVAYPGICGRLADFAGRGRTHRIDGVGVVNLADTEPPPGGTVEKRTHGFDTLFDMSGPSASLIPYSQLNNICLVLHTDRNLSESARAWAAEAATLRVSDAIAETVRGETPAEVQTFESPESDSDLPRVVYISCHGSPEHYADAVRAYGTSIYGLSRLNAPWLLNPNEWLDGAVAGRDSWILVNKSGDHGPLFPSQSGPDIRRLHRHPHKVEPAGREERDLESGRQDRPAGWRNGRRRNLGRGRERLHGGHKDRPGPVNR